MRFVWIINCLMICNTAGHSIIQNLSDDAICFKGKKFDARIIVLNNTASNLWQVEREAQTIDTSVCNRTISMLDSAIAIDSTYYPAYVNKASVFWRIKMRSQAIECLKLILNICDGYAEGAVAIGLFYEALGNKPDADKYYERGLRIYQNRIRKNNTFNSRGNEIYLLLWLGKKDSADYLINNLSSEFPADSIAIAAFKTHIGSEEKEKVEMLHDLLIH